VRYEYSTAINTDNERLVEEVKKRSILYEQTSNSYKEAKRKDAAQQEIAQELDCDGRNRCLLVFRLWACAQVVSVLACKGCKGYS
jgi:hypothetical protein